MQSYSINHSFGQIFDLNRTYGKLTGFFDGKELTCNGFALHEHQNSWLH